MRIQYTSQEPMEETYEEQMRKPKELERVEVKPSAIVHSLVIIALLIGGTFFLARIMASIQSGHAHYRIAEPLPGVKIFEPPKSEQGILASMGSFALSLGQSTRMICRWAELGWKNLAAFEESIDLLKTPSDPQNEGWV